MPIGQNQFLDRIDTQQKEFITQALLNKNLMDEAREASAWGSMTQLKALTPGGNGMFDAGDSIPDSVVWNQPLTEGTEARYTLVRRLKGEPNFGDQAPSAGDYFALLHDNVMLNKTMSPSFPVTGEMASMRLSSVIKDPKNVVRRNITNYMAEQIAIDNNDALYLGQSASLRAPKVKGGLAHPFHGSTTPADGFGQALNANGEAAQASPEIFYYPDNSGYMTQIAQGANRTAYEANVLAGLNTFRALATKQYFSRQSVQALYQLGLKHNLRKVSGGDYDFIYICDPAFLNTLVNVAGVTGSLFDAWKAALTGSGTSSKLFDTRGAIILDGIKLIPDAYHYKYRPDCGATGLTAGTPVLRWGQIGSGVYDRRSIAPAATDIIGVGTLLGDGALLSADNDAIKVTEEVKDHETSWEAAGHMKRGVKRAFWSPKDGTQGWTDTIQQNSLAVAFNVLNTIKGV